MATLEQARTKIVHISSAYVSQLHTFSRRTSIIAAGKVRLPVGYDAYGGARFEQLRNQKVGLSLSLLLTQTYQCLAETVHQLSSLNLTVEIDHRFKDHRRMN